LIVLTLQFVFAVVNNEEISSLLEEHMNEASFPGIAASIVEKGDVVFLNALGKNGEGDDLSTTDPMFIGSVSKSFTALAVMQLVEKGLVDLDNPVQNYIPYFEVKDKDLSKRITVRDVLVQKSGLSRKNQVRSFDFDTTIEERVRALSSMKAVTDRGEEFYYLNDNYNILGLLIEEVTNESYGEYMRKNIFEPLNMTSTTADIEEIREKDVHGYTSIFGFSFRMKQRVPLYDIPSGFILSNLEDMNKYVQYLLNPNSSILSLNGIQEMRKITGDSGYAMGWNVGTKDGLKVIEHSGAVASFSSHVALFPEEDSAYMYITNKNHLAMNFVGAFKNLNDNLFSYVQDEKEYNHFPSNWLLRIVSILILFLTLKDIWDTIKISKSKKTKKK
jgi:CubicO group peptidase (beta-lactamase class C family)